jgi:hypothetical protein
VITVSHNIGRKDAIYRHRFILWNKNFELQKYSEPFNIMDGHVEFVTGMIYKDDYLYITFGFQDNAAFLLKFPVLVLEDYL